MGFIVDDEQGALQAINRLPQRVLAQK